ncbi:MAG: type II toxin-antitoxin system HicA family toxin [Candidatus Chisholmbacteria bacterium]|nr:type II toxin-antitoxin system HicA family toxin [Candidatus Chisholmbacteria bacterium]
MPKLPVVSGKDLVKVLGKIGFTKVSQKGTHIKMQHLDGRVAIVPQHKSLKKGTLKKGILNPLGISVEVLMRLLKKK